MKRKWILIADDDENDATLVLRVLERDFDTPPDEVVVVRDGSEALDCLYRRKGYESWSGANPALVLLDLKMPKVGGWEVLRQLKSDARLKTIPVVVFTSSREESDLNHCYELGANGYVVKPLDLKDLTATMRGVRAFWLVVNEPPPQPKSSGSGKSS